MTHTKALLVGRKLAKELRPRRDINVYLTNNGTGQVQVEMPYQAGLKELTHTDDQIRGLGYGSTLSGSTFTVT